MFFIIVIFFTIQQKRTSILHSGMSLLCRYTFGKPVTGKLTVNMTVNGVGYYRHEMGQPVIKTMEVSLFNPYSTCFVNVLETSKLIWKQGC